jgi:acetyl esterase/lipase
MAHGFSLAYLWLKIRVAVVRLIVRCISPYLLRNDHALVTSMPVTKTRINIPTRNPNRTVTAQLYASSDYSLDSNIPTPVLVNWHGSGFVVPLLGSDILFCARVAQETGILVLDMDYRKAPEHPYPSAIEDVEDALVWIASQPTRFDLSRIAVSGFSAGGNLALVAATYLRKKLAETIKIPIVVAFYPLSDHSIAPELKVVPNPIRAISPRSLHAMSDCYVPDKSLRTDPKVSPGLASAEDFPASVVVITCEGDSLGPEGAELAKRLREEGRKVVHFEAKELHHGWDKGCKKGSRDEKERDVAYGTCVQALKEALGLGRGLEM